MNPTTGPLVTIGEAMMVLFPESAGPLADARTFRSDVGGAEFNVATTLGRLGLKTAWVSRLGADGLGDRIQRVASAAGVDTSGVERDGARPTGVYLKETDATEDGLRTRMHYYRQGSAASALDLATLLSGPASELLRSASTVHTSGITAALSSTTAEAVAGLRDAVGPSTRVSVDLNFRPQLWRERSTHALDATVAQADLLFVGRDEGEAYFGHADPARLFDAWPELDTIVIKDDSRQASVYRRGGAELHVPCLSVEVLEPVGAGDAFAAGFLAGLATGSGDATALRFGHALAALTLTCDGDRPHSVPTPAERDRIAAAGDDEWASWRVRPGHEAPWAAGS